MPTLTPKFHEVRDAFRVMFPVGSKETNEFVGRSRALATCYEVRNAVAGETLHSLPGGHFLETREGDLRHVHLVASPESVMLKTHGLPYTSEARLEELALSGRLRELDPATVEKLDYASVRRENRRTFAADAHDMRILEPSPEYHLAESELDPIFEMLDEMQDEGFVGPKGGTPKASITDHLPGRRDTLDVQIGFHDPTGRSEFDGQPVAFKNVPRNGAWVASGAFREPALQAFGSAVVTDRSWEGIVPILRDTLSAHVSPDREEAPGTRP